MIPDSSPAPKAKSQDSDTLNQIQSSKPVWSSLHYNIFVKLIPPIFMCEYATSIISSANYALHKPITLFYLYILGTDQCHLSCNPLDETCAISYWFRCLPAGGLHQWGTTATHVHHLDSSERAHCLRGYQAPTDGASYCRAWFFFFLLKGRVRTWRPCAALFAQAAPSAIQAFSAQLTVGRS